jgi:hypothetical protein
MGSPRLARSVRARRGDTGRGPGLLGRVGREHGHAHGSNTEFPMRPSCAPHAIPILLADMTTAEPTMAPMRPTSLSYSSVAELDTLAVAPTAHTNLTHAHCRRHDAYDCRADDGAHGGHGLRLHGAVGPGTSILQAIGAFSVSPSSSLSRAVSLSLSLSLS